MTPWPNTQKIPFSDHLKSRCDCSTSRISQVLSESIARILLPFRHCLGDFQKNTHVETLQECTSSHPSKLPFAHLVQHRFTVSPTPEHASSMASKSSIIYLLKAHRNRFVSCDSQATPSSASSKVPLVLVFSSGSKQSDPRVSQATESSALFKLPPGVFLKHEYQLPQPQEHHTKYFTPASTTISATIVSKEARNCADVPVTYSKLSEAPSSHSSAHTIKHNHSTCNSWKPATTLFTSSPRALSSTISAHVKHLFRKAEPLICRIENRIEEHQEARQIIKKQAKDNAPPRKHFLRATKSNDLTSVLGHLKAISSPVSISAHTPVPDIPILDEPATSRPATPILVVAPTSECRTPIRQTTTDQGDDDIFYTPPSRKSKISC